MRRTSLKEIKTLEEEYLVPVMMLVPITIEKQLKALVEQETLHTELTFQSIHQRRDDAMKLWLNTTEEGKNALFLARKKLLIEKEKTVKDWLMTQFWAVHPEYKPRMGRPKGIAPHRERKVATGKVVSEALVAYFRKQRKSNEER